MSGHSKWATTHRQKSATDAKRGVVFTKISNLITMAARASGGDINANFKLRLAVEKARAANVPKDKIEKAIIRGTGGGEKSNLEEAAYEALGPAGSAFIIEVITGNKNRAVAEIKNILNKNGGQLGGPNSVLWLFERKGIITIGLEGMMAKNLDEFELKLIDTGAQEIIKNEKEWEIYTLPNELQKTEKKIKNLGVEIKESSLAYIAKRDLTIADDGNREQIEKLFSALEDLDDVANVYTNANW